MNDKKRKYVIIDATKVIKELTKLHRVFEFNDFTNIYEPNGTISLKEVFEKHNIPEKYQKFILKLYLKETFRKCDASEFITGVQYDLKTKKNNIYEYQDYPKITSDIFAEKTMSIKLLKEERKLTDYNEVINFMKELQEKGHLENYINAIVDFLEINMDLNYLFGTYKETKNGKKTLKLYKKYRKQHLKNYIDSIKFSERDN